MMAGRITASGCLSPWSLEGPDWPSTVALARTVLGQWSLERRPER